MGVGEGQEEEEEAEAKEGKGKNKWWWWLDKCTSRACGATTTDNATGNSAPPGTHVRARSSLSADIFISFMGFDCLFNQQVCPSQTRLVRFENTMQLNAHCNCACSLVFFSFFQ